LGHDLDPVTGATPDDGFTAFRRSACRRGRYRDGSDMSRSERIGFWLYVAMGTFCMAVLVAGAMTATRS
jgi:hypothetical protein